MVFHIAKYISARNPFRRVGSWVVLCGFGVLMAGCHDFFSQKPTEIQSQMILRDLSKIETIPDANIVIPSIYRDPPKILRTSQGYKLFYFCRQQQVDVLEKLVTDQLAYRTSVNMAINQLIMECNTEEEAQIALEFLNQVDVAPIQVRIDCMVSELYADVTMDWETSIRIEDLFGTNITLTGKEIVDSTGAIIGTKPAFPGASLRDAGRNELGLKVGYSQLNGAEFSALIDLLVSRGYLKIMMNPTLEVVNGQQARIESIDNVPLPKEVVTKQQEPYTTTTYEKVIDSLQITPHVYADGYIGLETAVTIGSKSTPEGVRQIPIVTERTITNKENRIRQGESMIIGGIRKTEKRSVIRGVPVLKDIPLIGILFSSKDFEERAKEIVFIVTPTISRGGPDNASMVEWLKKKHEAPVGPTQLHEQLLDIIDPRTNVEDDDPNEKSEVYGPTWKDDELETDGRSSNGDYWELEPAQVAVPAPSSSKSASNNNEKNKSGGADASGTPDETTAPGSPVPEQADPSSAAHGGDPKAQSEDASSSSK